jgi:acetyl-CoA acetyltransferase
MIERDRYAIAGIAQTRVGKVPEMSDYGLQVEAAKMAMDDAGLKKDSARRCFAFMATNR